MSEKEDDKEQDQGEDQELQFRCGYCGELYEALDPSHVDKDMPMCWGCLDDSDVLEMEPDEEDDAEGEDDL